MRVKFVSCDFGRAIGAAVVMDVGLFKCLRIWAFVAVLTGFCVPAFADTNADFAALQTSLDTGNWDQAKAQAAALDANLHRGAFMAAYAASFRYAAEGHCYKASYLAGPLARISPTFMPAHDILVTCLLRDGRKVSAARYYRDLADSLPDGQVKKAALERAKRLKPNDQLRISLESMVSPSTNVVRQTSETEIGPFSITEDSRSKPGVSLSGNAYFTKPLFHRDRLTNYVRLKFGAQYNSVNKVTYPVAGVENFTAFQINPKTSGAAGVFYEHTWAKGHSHLDSYGTRASLSYQLKPDIALGANMQINWNDYADDLRDGLQFNGGISVTRVVNGHDRLTGSAEVTYAGARSKFIRYREVGISAEWEHEFENGFVPSLGGTVEYRLYDGNAPLSTEASA